jgi:chromosome segregation ATPase
MEAAAQFVAYVVIAILGILYARYQKQQGVREVTRQVHDPTSDIGGKIAEVKQETKTEAKQISENFFERYAKADIEAQKKRNEELEETLDRYMDRMDKLTDRTSQLEKDNVDLKHQVELERAAAETRKLEYQAQMDAQKKEYTSNNTKLTEQLKLMSEEYSDVVIQRDSAMKEVNRLSEELGATKQRIDDLTRQVQEQAIQIASSKAREETLLLVLDRFRVISVTEMLPNEEAIAPAVPGPETPEKNESTP